MKSLKREDDASAGQQRPSCLPPLSPFGERPSCPVSRCWTRKKKSEQTKRWERLQSHDEGSSMRVRRAGSPGSHPCFNHVHSPWASASVLLARSAEPVRTRIHSPPRSLRRVTFRHAACDAATVCGRAGGPRDHVYLGGWTVEKKKKQMKVNEEGQEKTKRSHSHHLLAYQ